MKSTYQILSSHLDGRPLAKDVQVRAWSSEDENLFFIDADRNILDFPHCRRVLPGSRLLVDDLAMIYGQIDLLNSLEELIVKIDYCSPMTVINKLFLKRILQAIGQLQQNHPNVVYIIAAEDSDFDRTRTIYEQIKGSAA